MKRLAKQAKKNEIVYSSLAQMMAEGEVDINEGVSTMNILTLISFGTCILHTIILVYIWYKLRLVTSAILLMSKAHASKISLVYTTSTTPQPFDLINELKENWQIEHWIFALQLIIIVIAISVLIKLITMRDRNQTVLMLHVTDGLQCVDLPLIRIKTCTSEWYFDILNNITNLNIVWSLKPKLNVEWSDFKVFNRITGQRLSVPNSINLTLVDAMFLYKILKGHFSAHVYLNDKGIKVPCGGNVEHELNSRNTGIYPNLSDTH